MANDSSNDMFIVRMDQIVREFDKRLRVVTSELETVNMKVSRMSAEILKAEAAAVRASSAADLLSGIGATDDSIAGINRRLRALEEELVRMTAQRNGMLLFCGLLLTGWLARLF